MRRVLTRIIPAIIGGAAGKATLGKGVIGAGIGLVATRIATRSIPGALLVGGALAAKWLYDKKQEGTATPEVTDAVVAMNEREMPEHAPPRAPITPPPATP
jgi:hypothetical protein